MSVFPSRNAPCPCGSGKKYKNCCLPADRAAAAQAATQPRLADAAARHAWEVGVFPLPTLIDDQPERRVSVVLVTADGLVLHHELLTDTLGRVDEVVDVLESALGEAEEGTGVRPDLVEVRHEEVAHALAMRLAPRQIDVEVERSLPGLEDAARALCERMLGMNVLPLTCSAPTWGAWGLSAAQCRSFFAAAAHFRRAAPWGRLADEPVSVLGRHGAWTAAVMGSGGEACGLVLYTEPMDFEYVMTLDLDLDDTVQAMEGAMITVAFEPRGALTREMQREVAGAGWEVADTAGYPVVFTSNTPAGGLHPTLVDALTGVLLAIPDFLDARGAEIVGGVAGQRIGWHHYPTGFDLLYDVPGGFAWPVPERLEAGSPQGAGADPEARITPLDLDADVDLDAGLDAEMDADRWELLDTFPDDAVVEAFQAHLRESVTAATAARHGRNAAALVEFLNGKQGVPLAALHELDLRSFLYNEFPLLQPGYTRTEALPGSLRKFFAFLAERHDLVFPWAEALLKDKQSLERRVYGAPVGGWWDSQVQYFRAELWADLDVRALLLPDDWAGALEPAAFAGIGEAQMLQEAQRQWLAWRDDLIRGGMDTLDDLEDALGARLLEWLDSPDPEDQGGRTRLAVIRAERSAVSTEEWRAEARRAMEQAFGEMGDEEG